MTRGVWRYAHPAQLFPLIQQTDNRGNTTYVPSRLAAMPFMAMIDPRRGARAEAPGQVEIDIIRIFTQDPVPLALWSIVAILGSEWDVVTPISTHVSSRRSSHYSADIRRRPTNGT